MALKTDKYVQLLHDKQPIEGKGIFHFMLSMMFFMQLILPIGIHAQGETGAEEVVEPEVSQVEEAKKESMSNIESPMSLGSQSENEAAEVEEDEPDSQELEEAPEEEISEEPAEEPVEEPVQKPKEEPEEKVEVKEDPVKQKTEKEPEHVEEAEDSNHETSAEEEEIEDVEDSEGDKNPGPGHDNFPGGPHPANPKSITRFSPRSLGAALTLLNKPMVMQATEDLQPGEVSTSKTATPVEGMVNTWDITVRVEGRDAQEIQTTDVVLVIDRSGSMEGSKMENLKLAGENFIDNTIPLDPNIRIAIVSYSSAYSTAQLYTIDHQFSQDVNSLKAAINGLTALGGTHTQAGIIQGRELLVGSNADNRYMILLSDGLPTYSYEPTSWATSSGEYYGVYNGAYNEGVVVGDGQTLSQRYSSGGWRNINNGSAAIRAGQDARIGINTLFTIGIQVTNEAANILAGIASPGQAYRADRPEELPGLYDTIRTEIATQYSIQDALITDEMGDGFTLANGSLGVTEGTTNVVAPSGSSNQTINWSIPSNIVNLVDGYDDIRYAEMTYRVEINPDILNAPVATPGATSEHDLFKTNKETTIVYTNVNEEETTAEFTSPEVDPVLLRVRKTLLDSNGDAIPNDPRLFNVQISKAQPNAFNQTESLEAGTAYQWLTTLRYEGMYNVEEIGITGPGETNLNQFMTSYAIDGDDKNTFEVNHDSEGIPRGDIVVDVTNQELAKIDVTGMKVWQGGPEVKPTIRLQLVRNGVDFSDPVTLEDGVVSYTWLNLNETDNLGNVYTYTVRELDVPADYNSVADDMTVTNTYVVPSAGTATAVKNWEGGDPADYYAVDLTLWRTTDGENFYEVIDPILEVTPNATGTSFSYEWSELHQTDFYGSEYTYYFTEDDVPDGFERIYSDPVIVSDMTYQPSGGTITNRQMLIDFSFIKVDEVGNPLIGAIFTLEKEVLDGQNEEMVNSGTDPEFIYEGLTIGWYTLTEVEAPDGFRLPSDNTWRFEVYWDDETDALAVRFDDGDALELEDAQYEVANYPQTNLPETGGPGMRQAILIGLFSLAMLGIVYGWQLKRDEVFPDD